MNTRIAYNLYIDINAAKRNRERIENILERESLVELSDHDDLCALHFIDMRKHQTAEVIKRGFCPRCEGRILGDSCINCGYSV